MDDQAAALKIQRYWKGSKCRFQWKSIQQCIITIQSHYRRRMTVKEFKLVQDICQKERKRIKDTTKRRKRILHQQNILYLMEQIPSTQWDMVWRYVNMHIHHHHPNYYILVHDNERQLKPFRDIGEPFIHGHHPYTFQQLVCFLLHCQRLKIGLLPFDIQTMNY